jgi:hypothetical protein
MLRLATGRDAEIKDTAAAAIVASALLELARLHPDAVAGKKWGERGLAVLEVLCRDEFIDRPGPREAARRGQRDSFGA